MNAAAIIYVVLLFLSASYPVLHHGQPRPPYSAGMSVMSLGLSLFLLWQAGFFQ